MSVDIRQGNALDVLRGLSSGIARTCVTSPPYYGLRDYGMEDQIGLEDTPEAYVARLVDVFREVRRVLTDDGTAWLNLGDSYASDSKWGGATGGKAANGLHGSDASRGRKNSGLPDKNLIGIPWRVAFALQADGWILRQDIIWQKPNPMPESVRDRCTKAHEYVFLLSKSQRYFYDAEAVKEPVAAATVARLSQDLESQQGSARVPGKTNGTMKAVGAGRPQLARARELAEQHGLTEAHFDAIRAVGMQDAGKNLITQIGAGKNAPEMQALAAEAKAALGGYYREFLSGAGRSSRDSFKRDASKRAAVIPGQTVGTHRPDREESDYDLDTRNKRSVWSIATLPFKEAHFAVMPVELAVTCILAGSRPGDTVLDPFMGAYTTAYAALQHGRSAVGAELNPAYMAIGERRIRAVLNQPRLLVGGAASTGAVA